jgi:hypothetical protein
VRAPASMADGRLLDVDTPVTRPHLNGADLGVEVNGP